MSIWALLSLLVFMIINRCTGFSTTKSSVTASHASATDSEKSAINYKYIAYGLAALVIIIIIIAAIYKCRKGRSAEAISLLRRILQILRVLLRRDARTATVEMSTTLAEVINSEMTQATPDTDMTAELTNATPGTDVTTELTKVTPDTDFTTELTQATPNIENPELSLVKLDTEIRELTPATLDLNAVKSE